MSYPRALRVLFDFEAGSDVELSVRAGDIVICNKPPQDQWVLAYKHMRPEQRGYIPFEFCEEMSSGDSRRYVSMQPGLSSALPLSSSLAPAPATSFSSSTLAMGAMQPVSPSAGVIRTPYSSSGPNSATPILSSGSAAGPGLFNTSMAVAPPPVSALAGTMPEVFSEQEAHFRSLMRSREETFRKLESSMTATTEEIRQCQSRNAELNAKIRELEMLVDDERRKWKDRLETEKKQMVLQTVGQ